MKEKTKAFADTLLKDPKTSAAQAYVDTHATTNTKAARVNASKLLAKPEVQIYMQKHVDKARKRMVELMDSKKEEIAHKAITDILDRTYGKAIAYQHNTNTNINLNIQASQEKADQFTAFLKHSIHNETTANKD